MSTHTVHYCTTCWLSFFGKIINWHIALSLTVANFEPNIQLITSALAAVDSFSCFPCLNWICWWTLTCLSSIWLETITFPDSPFQLQVWKLPWRKCRRQSCTLHWEIQSTDFQAAWIIQKKCRQWCQVMKPSKIENIYILWEWSRNCFFSEIPGRWLFILLDHIEYVMDFEEPYAKRTCVINVVAHWYTMAAPTIASCYFMSLTLPCFASWTGNS